ncbi:MAG: archaeoflavoprotein AfpA [Euryarchaeota archaeon]|nr:archaeoflavoprotein AfpA [Euryarchaeota archaeon]
MTNKKKRIAWGITGAGERLLETFEVMRKIREMYKNDVEIKVYISKSGDQVVKYYRIFSELEKNFDNVWVEINANSPFLAGQIQLGKFDFLLIAPATSNTVAKISLRIADTLLTNAAIMGQKAGVPIYIMPSDYKEGVVVTKLPNGKDLKLTIRKEDVEHVEKLANMENTFVLEDPEEICGIFEEYLKV